MMFRSCHSWRYLRYSRTMLGRISIWEHRIHWYSSRDRLVISWINSNLNSQNQTKNSTQHIIYITMGKQQEIQMGSIRIRHRIITQKLSSQLWIQLHQRMWDRRTETTRFWVIRSCYLNSSNQGKIQLNLISHLRSKHRSNSNETKTKVENRIKREVMKASIWEAIF